MKELLHQLEHHYHHPEQCAQDQNLVYFMEDTPGFRRQRWGRGFRYFDPAGSPVKASPIKERLSKIPAPPAWKDVWLAPEDNFHVLAIGEDEAGRKQYTYHPRWSEYRNRLKYYHLLTFANVLAPLRKQAYQALQPFASAQDIHPEGLYALMVLLLDKGALRIGSEYYYDQRETVGLTTLGPAHVSLKQARIELCYPAKSGKERCIQLQNKQLSEVLQSLKNHAVSDTRLFSYLKDEEPVAISGDQLKHYINRQSNLDISAKDFRTWKGTLEAFKLMKKAHESKAELSLKDVVDHVSHKLGNTPAIARQSYIHSDLIALWQSGEFDDYVSRQGQVKRKAYFSKDEAELCELLSTLFKEKMQPLFEGYSLK
jgi:DNA topoisomerase I